MWKPRKLSTTLILAFLFLSFLSFLHLEVWHIEVASATSYGTFGTTSIGGDNHVVNNSIVGTAYECLNDAEAQNISVAWEYGGGSVTGKCMIYFASNGSLVGTTNEVTDNPGSATFVTYPFTVKPNLTSGISYYLVFWTNTSTRIYHTYSAPDTIENQTQDYGAPPATFSHSTLYASNKLSIYCSYKISESGPPEASDIIIDRQKAATSATVTCNWSAVGDANLTNGVSIFCSNVTGSFANSSAVTLSGTSAWGNQTVTLPSAGNVVTCWFYANDSLNQWARTSNIVFQVFSDDMALHVEGNKMYEGNGSQVILKGIDYTYLMDGPVGYWYDPETGDRLLDFSKTMEEGMNYTLDFLTASNCNIIRVIGTVEYWVEDSSSYRTNIERFCELAQDHGIYFMFAFYSCNSSKHYTNIPWLDVGNGYIEDAEDLEAVWETVSDRLKGYSNFIPEYWNEPLTTEEWFDCVQVCLSYSRSVGIAGVIDIACAPSYSPLTYDFAPGGIVGFQDLIPVALSYLNDTAFNLMFDLHAYWDNLYNSSDYAQRYYVYDDIETWLNVTGCYDYSETYVLNVGEIGYDNFDNATQEQAWLNNTFHIFDDLGIGYQEWAGPPWANAGLSNQWGFIENAQPNFTLTAAGQIWLNHTGGTNYTVWLESEPPPTALYYFDLDFWDVDSNPVELIVNWQLFNGTTLLNYASGDSTLLAGVYTLKVYYHNIHFYTSSLNATTYGNSTVNTVLQMKHHTSISSGYLVSNTTLTGLTIHSQTETNLTFMTTGGVPAILIIDFPIEPSYISRDGVNQTGWSYTETYIVLTTNQLSTWQIIYVVPTIPETPPTAEELPDNTFAYRFTSGQGWAFGVLPNNQTFQFTVISGTWNGTGTCVFYTETGSLTLLENQAATIQILKSPDFILSINSTQMASGDTFTVGSGTTYIAWSIVLHPLLPYSFIIGMTGLSAAFAGPLYGIYKVKHGEYYDGFRMGVVITAIGFALTIAWLWGA